MNETIHTYEGEVDGKFYRLEVNYDGDVADPMSEDHLGEMICFTARSHYGDKHDYKSVEDWLVNCYAYQVSRKNSHYDDAGAYKLYDSFVEEQKFLAAERHTQIDFAAVDRSMMERITKRWGDIFMPVYKYEHSGIRLSTAPFSCPWDSGQIGFLHATKLQVREWFGVARADAACMQRAEETMTSYLDYYSKWVDGNSYWLKLESRDNEDGEWEMVDSCGGYIGDYDDVASEFLQNNGLDTFGRDGIKKWEKKDEKIT